MLPNVSVIITTYNFPTALRLVLLALACQDAKNFEVIIADDGSDTTTRQLIDDITTQVDYKIRHVWQPHEQFRAGTIRNKAVALAQNEYLIFLDGDSIPRTSFVRHHQLLAENHHLVAGNRILLTQKFSHQVLKANIPLHNFTVWQWSKAYFSRAINRLLPILNLGYLYPRKLRTQKWQGVKACNLGLWKKDFIAVNGFDENYCGWGYEDSDLVIRLLRNGCRRKDGSFFIPVFHLWHEPNARSNNDLNWQRLQQLQGSKQIMAKHGVQQYLC